MLAAVCRSTGGVSANHLLLNEARQFTDTLAGVIVRWEVSWMLPSINVEASNAIGKAAVTIIVFVATSTAYGVKEVAASNRVTYKSNAARAT